MLQQILLESSKMADVSPPKYELVSKPSKVLRSIDEILDIDRVCFRLNLVIMKRTFLLVISSNDGGDTIRQGLSLAIGKHNTTIIESENSLASASLATLLSEKLNLNRPVYVANNFQLPYDSVDPDKFMSKLNLKLFQFVRANYKIE